MLIKVEAIINEEKFEDVKEALNAIHVNGITVSQVMGCGTQRGLKRYVRGSEVEINLLPKIKLEIVVSSEKWEEKVIDTIQKTAYTGNVGLPANHIIRGVREYELNPEYGLPYCRL